MKINVLNPRTKHYGLLLILLLLIVPIISIAQPGKYTKAVKGDRVQFDTAVIVEIGQYRAETKKLRAADQLLRGYETEILSMSRISSICDSLHEADRGLIASQDRMLRIKEHTIGQLTDQFNALLKIQAPRKTWFDRNKFWVGLIAGGGVSAYICSK